MQRSLLLALLGCILTSARAQENLIRNPSFEGAPGTNGLPGSGWWLFEGLGETGVKVDRAVAHSGQASVRLQSKEPAKCVLVSPSFEVAPGDELQFKAWVRSEQASPNTAATFAGLAFRHPDGQILERAYARSSAVGQSWVLISGTAKAPEGVSTAEMHLGYTNAPGALWYDDVAAVITSPVSFSLIEGAKPWPGEQEITLRIINRQTNQFRGSIAATMGKQTKSVPVVLAADTRRGSKVPLTFSGVGAHDYKISLLDEAGAPLRVLQGKFRTPPTLVLFPPCPCYHLADTGDGATRIDARLNLNPARRTGLKFNVRLSDASGQPIQSLEADPSNGDTVGLNLHVPTQKIGAFKVAAHLLDAAGHELARAENEVHVIQKETAQVTLGADDYLRVAGKPEFPIGMYNCGHYEEMAKAGFDATHEYGITTGEADAAINSNDIELQQLLDKSWANGVRMMVEFPRKAIEKARWEQIRRRIETFRHHPGLLCWGSEERVARGTCPLSHVAQLYALAHELDPDHPLVLGDTRDVIQKLQKDRRDFFPDACMDVGIWWWYPIPLKEPDGNGLEGGPQLRTMARGAFLAHHHAFQKTALDCDSGLPETKQRRAFSHTDGVPLPGLHEHHRRS
jgi:hypothetical protein